MQILNNRISNLAFPLTPLCVPKISLNSSKTKVKTNSEICIPHSSRAYSIDMFTRSPIYNSLIKLDFKNFSFINLNVDAWRAHVNAFHGSYQLLTQKANLSVSAAYLILSLPMLFIVLSTTFLETVHQSRVPATLPNNVWAILDKFFIKVNRPNSMKEPGLNGVIESVNSQTTVEFLREFASDEQLILVLDGTPFQGLLHRYVDKNGNVAIEIDDDLKSALNAIITPFEGIYPNTPEFVRNVSDFYNNLASQTYAGRFPLITKMPERDSNIEVGLHKLLNLKRDGLYAVHYRSIDSMSNAFVGNSILVLLKLFSPKFYSCVAPDHTHTVAGDLSLQYGFKELDTTAYTYRDAFNTLYSVYSTPQIGSSDKKNTEHSREAMSGPFGVARSYSTETNIRVGAGSVSGGLVHQYQQCLMLSDTMLVLRRGPSEFLHIKHEWHLHT